MKVSKAVSKKIVTYAESGPIDASLSQFWGVCSVCSLKTSRYRCPRCSAPFCCAVCYSQHGIRCTEEFNRSKVEDILALEKRESDKDGFEERYPIPLMGNEQLSSIDAKSDVKKQYEESLLAIAEKLSQMDMDETCLTTHEKMLLRRSMKDPGQLKQCFGDHVNGGGGSGDVSMMTITSPSGRVPLGAWWRCSRSTLPMSTPLISNPTAFNSCSALSISQLEDNCKECKESTGDGKGKEGQGTISQLRIQARPDLYLSVMGSIADFSMEIFMSNAGPNPNAAVVQHSSSKYHLFGLLMGYVVMSRSTLGGRWHQSSDETGESLEEDKEDMWTALRTFRSYTDVVTFPSKGVAVVAPVTLLDAIEKWLRHVSPNTSTSPKALLTACLSDLGVILSHPADVLYCLMECWLLGQACSDHECYLLAKRSTCGYIPNATDIASHLQKYLATFNSRIPVARGLGADKKASTSRAHKDDIKYGQVLARKAYFYIMYCTLYGEDRVELLKECSAYTQQFSLQ